VPPETRPEFIQQLYDDLRDRLRAKDQERAIELLSELIHSGRPLSEIIAETVPASATPKRREPDCFGHPLPTDASEAAPEPSPEPTLSSTSERALQSTAQSVPPSIPEPMLEGAARSSADLVAQKSSDSAVGKQPLIQAAPDAQAAWLSQDRPEFEDAGVFNTDALGRKPAIIPLFGEPMPRRNGEIRTEVQLLYRELEDHVRANNLEGIRRIYRNLLQAGRSVSEITETMHTYTLKSASKSELEISPNNELPQRAARPELAKSSSELTSLDSDLAVRSDTPRGSLDSTPNLADESEPRGPKGHAQFSHPSSVRRFAALRSPIAQLAIIGVAATAGGLLLLDPAGEKLAVMATSVLHPSSLPSEGASLTLMMSSAIPPEHAPELTTTGPMPAPATTPRDEELQTSAAAPAALAPDTTPTVAPPGPALLTEVAPIVAAAPAPDTTPIVAQPDTAPLTEAALIVAPTPVAPAPDTTPIVAQPDTAPLTEAVPIVAPIPVAPAPDTTPIVAQPNTALLTEAAPIAAPTPAAPAPDTAPTVAMTGLATPPAEPRASALKISARETSSLLTRGDSLFGVRDVTSARLYYERAADAGDAQAALRLGETYDPSFLALARLNGVRGDPVVAARWYRHARDLGNPEAEILLKSLHAN